VLFDIFSEQQMIKPFPANHQRKAFTDAIEQAQLADRLGFDCWWQTEHHGASEFSYSSCPELSLTAVALATERIRVGHAGVLVQHEVNHPVRIAERTSVIDILSQGRMEVGLARAGVGERLNFNITSDSSAGADESMEELEDVVDILTKAWTEERFSFDGKFIHIPDMELVPRPFQSPHPRLWMTTQGTDAVYKAGSMGLGAIGLTLMAPLSLISELRATYDRGLAEGTTRSKVHNPQFGMFTFAHVTETREEAIENGAIAAAMWFIEAFPPTFKIDREMFMSFIRGKPTARADMKNIENILGNADPNDPHPVIRVLNRHALGMEVDWEEAYDIFDAIPTVLMGDVDTVRKKVATIKDHGMDRLLTIHQFGGLSHENALNSIRLLGEEIMPKFV